MKRIAIHGAAGRMGKRLIDLGHADPELELCAALESPEHPQIGQDSGEVAGIQAIGVPISAQFPDSADALIDFSLPIAVPGIISKCLESSTPLVVATTGFGDDVVSTIRQAAENLAIVWAPNMSLAVNLSMKLAEVAAGALVDSDADVEIIERHHRFKADAPSGTALKFGELIARQMNIEKHQHGRHGETGARPHNEIGYHAVRAGDDAGQHTILFGMLGEKIEIKVAASNRDCYARGALAAAKFLVGRPAGLYDMYDVLGLNQK